MDTVIKRQQQRFLFLKSIYELTGGDTLTYIPEPQIAEVLGLSPDEVEQTSRYLLGEKLIKYVSGPKVSLTHPGVVEVEAKLAQPDEPTVHFPTNIIIIGEMHGSSIQQGTSGSTQTSLGSDYQTPGAHRFEGIRSSFESLVRESSFHELVCDRAVLAVCLVPDQVYRTDLNSIHGMLPPLLETQAYYESETHRQSEVTVVEGPRGKSVLEIDREGTIRAASTLAINGATSPKFIRLTGTERYIRSGPLQKTLVHSLRLWAEVLRQSEVPGPFRLGVSLLEVKGWGLLLADRAPCDRRHKEPMLPADPIPIPSLANFRDPQAIFETLKPALDEIARGFGLPNGWPVFPFGIDG